MSKYKKGFLLFLIPLFAVQIFIYVVPMFDTIISTFKITTIVGESTFTLTGNFRKVSNNLWPIIGRTLIWTIGSISVSMIIGLAAALLFNRDFVGKKAAFSAVLMPYTIPLIIVAACWQLLYQPDFGWLNKFLQTCGIVKKSVHFLSKDSALIAVIIARIWRSLPFAFLSYYAALKSIPISLYEASKVDGAKEYQNLFYITLPQLKSITITTGVILTVWTFLVFDIIFTMTGGGPGKATTILPIAIYQETVLMYDKGAASALSLISICILIVLTSLYLKALKGDDSL
jgi:multiple sugar transport system permease protein